MTSDSDSTAIPDAHASGVEVDPPQNVPSYSSSLRPRKHPNYVKPQLTNSVFFADRILTRTRRWKDVLNILACVIGIAIIWLISAYADSTTRGVTEDVRHAFSSMSAQILMIPVSMIEGIVILGAPIAVIISLAYRRRLTDVIVSVLTALGTTVVGFILQNLLERFPQQAVAPLNVVTATGYQVAINVALMTLTAFFTTAGESSNNRMIQRSWWLLFLIALLGIMRGSMTVQGALIALLAGRICGSLARWLAGFEDNLASSKEIVHALLSIGIIPSRIIRTDIDTEDEPLRTWKISSQNTPNGFRLVKEKPEIDQLDIAVNPMNSQEGTRHYQVWDHSDNSLEMTVVDPGRKIFGAIKEIWQNLRLRGISRWVSPSLKANAERAMLTSLSAMRAGVNVPEPLGLTRAGDSIIAIGRTLPPSSPLHDLDESLITDDMLDAVWTALTQAHVRGIAHRNLTFESVIVDYQGKIWLTNWSQGEVGAGELARRIDVAQMLIHLGVCAGMERACASATRILGEEELRACAPAIQSAVLPASINSAVRHSQLITKTRENLITDSDPTDSSKLLKLQRFSAKTIFLVVVLVVMLFVLLAKLNFHEMADAIKQANPLWIIVAAVLGSTTWLGTAVPLVAATKEKIRIRDAFLAQIAASVIVIIAPAGVGPAALNMRFLVKQKVSTAMSVVSVVLVQLSQFLTTIILIVIIVISSGGTEGTSLPYSKILALTSILAAVVAACAAVPQVRRWLWKKIGPTWLQVYPRILWIMGQPSRLLALIGGNLLSNIGYIGSFWACLEAFGYHLNLITLSVTYLASNAVGSVMPSPGGMGPVEMALTGGLVAAGVPSSIALSTTLLYRLLNFYLRIVFGWGALKIMQKKNLL